MEYDTHFYRLESETDKISKLDFIDKLFAAHHIHGEVLAFNREDFFRNSQRDDYFGFAHVLDATVVVNCSSRGRNVGTITGRIDAIQAAKLRIEQITGYVLIETDPLNGGEDRR